MFKSLLITLFSCLALINVQAENDALSYVVKVQNDEDMELSDSAFYMIARSVVFPVNKYNIKKNSDFYKELVNEVIPEMNKKGYRLERVVMRGAASPEGPLAWNKSLGEKRKHALFKLVDKLMTIPSCEDCLKDEVVPEDYKYLLLMMQQRGDADYERVKSLVDRYDNPKSERLKQKLMAVDGGSLWKRLLREYFPELRAARVVFFFKPARIEYVAELGKQPPLSQTIFNNAWLELPLPEDPTQQTVSPADIFSPSVDTGVADTVKQPRREFLSVKTNLLLDFAYMPAGYDRFCPMPNIAIEYYPLHGHFTYGASFDCPWWRDYWAFKFFQVRNYQLETRYYLLSGDESLRPAGQGAAFRGLYLQAYTHLGLYSICFSPTRGWEGEGVGAGVGLGYVLPLTKKGHWRLEFGAQFGYFWTKYDPYQWECPIDPEEHDQLYYYKTNLPKSLFEKRQHRFSWVGPTRVGITLSYDLLYRKNKKRGVSLAPWEKGGSR